MAARDIEPTGLADITRRLKWTREAYGWSQAELCRRSGISTSSWNNVETGDYRIAVDDAIKLCRAAHVTLDWIYRGLKTLLPAKVADYVAAAEAGAKPGARRRA